MRRKYPPDGAPLATAARAGGRPRTWNRSLCLLETDHVCRLQVGLSTTFLMLQAQRDLATAQTSELRALLDFRKALVDLEQAEEAP